MTSQDMKSVIRLCEALNCSFFKESETLEAGVALFTQRSALKAGLTKTEINNSGSLKFLSFTNTVSVNTVNAERLMTLS